MEWNSWEKLLATVRIYFESEDILGGKRQELGPFFFKIILVVYHILI
jgi:hypothetical protein